MLDLLFAPAQCGRLEFGIVGEDPAEVVRVSAAIMLDEARRLDDADELRIELVALEALPGNIVERPPGHSASLRRRDSAPLYPEGETPLNPEAYEAQCDSSERTWSLARAMLCWRSNCRNSSSRCSRSVPVTRAT